MAAAAVVGGRARGREGRVRARGPNARRIEIEIRRAASIQTDRLFALCAARGLAGAAPGHRPPARARRTAERRRARIGVDARAVSRQTLRQSARLITVFRLLPLLVSPARLADRPKVDRGARADV